MVAVHGANDAKSQFRRVTPVKDECVQGELTDITSLADRPLLA